MNCDPLIWVLPVIFLCAPCESSALYALNDSAGVCLNQVGVTQLEIFTLTLSLKGGGIVEPRNFYRDFQDKRINPEHPFSLKIPIQTISPPP